MASNNHISTGNMANAICMRCKMTRRYTEMVEDLNKKGLWVCPQCQDEKDPYRLPPISPDPLTLRRPFNYRRLVAPQYQNLPVYDSGGISTGDVIINPPVDTADNGIPLEPDLDFVSQRRSR